MSKIEEINKDGFLPCPFCGEYPEVTKGKSFGWQAECKNYDDGKCNVFVRSTVARTEEKLKEVWNKRH